MDVEAVAKDLRRNALEAIALYFAAPRSLYKPAREYLEKQNGR